MGSLACTGHSLDPEKNVAAAAKKDWGSLFLPAAGNRNGSEFNNAGSNGNYWSASLNESNPNNAWGMNFGSDYQDVSARGRFYGQSVRAVRSQN